MSADEKRPLGKILLQRKLVSPQQLDAALKSQRTSDSPEPIASQLVASGAVDELEALRALSEQHGIPGIDLNQVAIAVEHLDVVPRQLADSGRMLPVLVRGDQIFLAVANPSDKRIIDELEFVSGKRVFPYVAVQSTLLRTIAAAYEAKTRGERYYLAPCVPEETLRQLGIVRSAPPLRRTSEGPPKPAVIIEEAVESASSRSELSTSDFGVIGNEVSSVANLPDDLRQGASKAAGAVGAGGGRLVLVVDDDEEIRKLLTRLLTQKGLRVIEADRGLLALRLVKEHVPELIMLDAMLPELHGFDIARRIKGSAKYGGIPIVMMSAVYKGWRIAEDLKTNYGISEFLEKPFRVADVLSTVQNLLAQGDDRSGERRDPEQLSVDAEAALKQGIDAYRAGRIEAAIGHLVHGVSIDPLAYRLHFHLGLLYGKKGQIYEGIHELERAIDLNPRHFPALKNLAVLYEKAGFRNKAVEMWERCASAAPDAETRESVKTHLRGLI